MVSIIIVDMIVIVIIIIIIIIVIIKLLYYSFRLRQQDLEQAKVLYAKVNKIGMYPPNADLKLFSFDDKATAADASNVKEGVMQGLGIKQSQ